MIFCDWYYGTVAGSFTPTKDAIKLHHEHFTSEVWVGTLLRLRLSFARDESLLFDAGIETLFQCDERMS